MNSTELAAEFFDAVSRLPSPVVYCTIVGILLACGLGLPVPEDITLLTAGLLASAERISLPGAMIAGFGGVLVGDTFLFFLGRKYGKSIFKLPGFRRIFTPARVASAEARIRKNGPFICFVARFLPGVRSAIFAMSGALGVRFTTFLALDGLAALLSVPLWVYVGYWFGENFEDALGAALATSEKLQVYILSGIGVLIVSYVAYKFLRRKQYQRELAAMSTPGEPLEAESISPGISKLK